jgi:hypothetical protein
VSIVRVGLAETQKFAEGYEAIFGKKDAGTTAQAPASAGKKGRARKARPAQAKARGGARKSAKKARK